MNVNHIVTFTTIIVVATVTGLTRAMPYLVFGKKELPDAVRYLGDVLPASIMIILVVYCLRNTNLATFPFGLSELISIAIIVYIQVVKKNTFLSISAGTVIYMVLIRTIFI